MSDRAAVRFQLDTREVDWPELERLFKEAGLSGCDSDKTRRAFEKSSLVCLVQNRMRLVAVGRALSDGEYHATIYDVVVHVDYQRRGIGSDIVAELLTRFRIWRVLLVADRDAQQFYL